MSSDYDASEFIDGDLEDARSPRAPAPRNPAPHRAPTREEVDSRVIDAQQKLAELKRAQEELERERAALEETRRRQMEFQTGRKEMVQSLTRGVGLLEEAELGARRTSEQMAKTLSDFKEALAKIQSVQEDAWTKENFQVELTRALTTLENARMEWNAARLKFDVLSGTAEPKTRQASTDLPAASTMLLGGYNFAELCRLGFALTWPVAAAVLLMGTLLLFTLLRN